ncbi:hypothetical protein GCM10020001_097500 [Nonomuraea salmonea]
MHPEALTRRARRHGWKVASGAGPVVAVERHHWRMRVTFTGTAPQTASIIGPDLEESRPVNLRLINTLLRASPAEIAEHAAEAIIGGRQDGDRART